MYYFVVINKIAYLMKMTTSNCFIEFKMKALWLNCNPEYSEEIENLFADVEDKLEEFNL